MASDKKHPSVAHAKETLDKENLLQEYVDKQLYDLTWSHSRHVPEPAGVVFPSGVMRFETHVEALIWIRQHLIQGGPHQVHFLSLKMLMFYRESSHGMDDWSKRESGWLTLLRFNSDADPSRWTNVGNYSSLFQASDFLAIKTDHKNADTFATTRDPLT